ncbi:MAG: RNA methyltransferase [Actinomycetota bacterium]|nr:RNA methyltransferase [Actinomycetota bacterium]
MSDEPALITSVSNPLVTHIRKLARRKARVESGQTFVEGIATVRQAIESGAAVETVIITPDLLRSDEAARAAEVAVSRGATLRRMDAELFKKISTRDHPTGIAAVVSTADNALEDIDVDASSVVVLLDDVANPGNLGTVARTADAIGARGLILSGATTDPWDPAAIKASMGTLFELPVCKVATAEAAIDWARSVGLATIATSARAAESIYEADVSLPALVMFGSEREGLRRETLAAADLALRIPIGGHASSLNLAVAAGICLFEVARRGRPT